MPRRCLSGGSAVSHRFWVRAGRVYPSQASSGWRARRDAFEIVFFHVCRRSHVWLSLDGRLSGLGGAVGRGLVALIFSGGLWVPLFRRVVRLNVPFQWIARAGFQWLSGSELCCSSFVRGG